MDVPQERRTLWRTDLADFLTQFTDDNRRAHSVEDRWLAQKVTTWLEQVRQVSWPETNTNRIITPEIKAFRLAEIAAARKKLAAQDAEFEQEAQNLTVAKEKGLI